MIFLIEKMLGGKMTRQAVEGFEEQIKLEKDAVPPGRKATAPAGGRKKFPPRPSSKARRSNRSTTFDFGLRQA